MFPSPVPPNPDPATQGNLLLQRGDFTGAARAYRQALKQRPNQPDILHRLAISQAQLGDYDDAARDLERALRLRPKSAQLLTDLAQIHIAAQRYDDAERAYQRAEAADPSFTFVHGAEAELYQLTGEFDKAARAVETGLRKNPGDLRLALAYAKLAPRLSDDGSSHRRAIELLEPHLRSLPQNPATNEARMNILFRLADQHDRLGEHDRAFERYVQANACSPRRFDPQKHAQAIDRMIEGWTPEALAGATRSERRDELPLLIVGMPRSGTSLVEQILACHREVHGGGELPHLPRICVALGGGPNDATAGRGQEPMLATPARLTRAELERHQRAYLAELRKLAPKASRVTDKLPNNFMNLGLISLLLPGVRVIHCTRDPLDTCCSCFFQHFLAPFPWSYRLDWLGAYHAQYRRIMRHWTGLLTDLPMLEVPYEELTAAPESWIPRIVEFAGLEWDDACLRFHESRRVTATLSNEQVRRPMYRSSVGRHRNYDAHLGPLRDALGIG